MQRSKNNRISIFILCLMIVGVYRVCTNNVYAKGGVSGGGADRYEAIFQEQQIYLYEMLKRDQSNSLTIEEKQQILLESRDGLIQVDYSDSINAIQTDNIVNAKIILNPKKLKDNFDQIDIPQALEILISAHAEHFKNPEVVKNKLLSILKKNILIPEFFKKSNIKLSSNDSQSVLSGCRDHISLLSNPFTGEVRLQATSSDSCLLNDSPEKQSLGSEESNIQFISMNYACKPIAEKTMKCLPIERRNSDFIQCTSNMIDKTLNSSTPPEIIISSNGDVDIHFVWCVQVDNNVYKRKLDRKYKINETN